MTSLSINQLTLNFEPGLAERFPSLRDYIAHRVQVQSRPAKSIAGDMDMSPSSLSRKLSPGETDTARFNIDDLETYIQATRDTTPIEYLAAKYLGSDDLRKARAIARVESLASELTTLLSSIKGGV